MIDFKLNKIIIENFTCYYGKNEIEFPFNKDKNIFLFNLRNGQGKTSLFHAIKWGFYGERVEYFKDSTKIKVKDFLNDRIKGEKEKCSVEIFFEYGDDSYVLKRTLNLSGDSKSFLILEKNGEPIVSGEARENELSKILPSNFADFFMFDGEQLSKFMKAQKDLIYRDSVYQLLGLKSLEILKRDLESLKSDYEDKLNELDTTNKEAEIKKGILNGIKRDIKNHEISIKRYEEKISDNDQIRESLEEKFKKFEKLPKIFDKLRGVQQKIAVLNSDIKMIKISLEESSAYLFLKFLKKDIEENIKDNENRIKELQNLCGMSDAEGEIQEIRNEIVKKSIPICNVCKHKLTGTEKDKLIKLKKGLEENIATFKSNKIERDNLKSEINILKNLLEESKSYDIQKKLDNLKEKQSILKDLKGEENKLFKESQKKEYGEHGEIQRQINIIIEDNTTKRNQINSLKQSIEILEKDKADTNKSLQRLGHDDKNLNKITSIIQLISRLFSSISEALSVGTVTKRDKIIECSNKIFLSITNKEEEFSGIEFENEDSFSFVIKTKDGKRVTNPSKGEKQVLAMSFLLGLNQYTGRNNIILMDTPIASLDDKHSAMIGKALSTLKNQVIFLAQPQEIFGDVYKNMKNSISKEFTVTRKDYRSILKGVKK